MARSLVCRLCGGLTYQGEPDVPHHCGNCKRAAHWRVASDCDVLVWERQFLRSLNIDPYDCPTPEDDGA